MLKILSSFLTNRKFRVRIGDVLSDLFIQINGIPQGSVLSTTLFIVAVNGLADNIPATVRKALYVDDLSIYLKGKLINDIVEILQATIDIIVEEARRRGLQFSAEKTKCIHFCRLRKPHEEPSIFLNGKAIAYEEQVKFLGVIIDRKLYWDKHINYLEESAKKSLKIIKTLANFHWGADQETLIKILVCLIRSRFEYGCQVFSSARPSRLRKLDIVFNKGLRLATGAFRTTPVEDLYKLAGVPTLPLRRQQLCLRYAEKIKALDNHFLRSSMRAPPKLLTYRYMPTRSRPLPVRSSEILNSWNLEKHQVAAKSIPLVPPWRLAKPRINLGIAKFAKDTTDAGIYKKLFLEAKEKYKDFKFVYTDGSKTDDGVGLAFVTDNMESKWKLPKEASIFTAELWAILKAVDMCNNNKDVKKWLLCTDSMSVATALKDMFTRDPLLRKVMEIINEMKADNREMVIMWIPSHIGIAGNEQVDQAARAAITDESPLLPLRLEDVINAIDKEGINIRRNQWDASGTKLRQILSANEDLKWPPNTTRKERILITRLATGHTRLTHSHLLLGMRQPLCPQCSNAPLTIIHIFTCCQALEHHRRNHHIVGTLKDLLSDGANYNNIISFLNTVKLFREL